jgi:hypothetical protein
MDTLIELPDLLSKLKIVSYVDYALECKGETIAVTLVTRQGSIRYAIIDPITHEKQSELDYLLKQYRA